MTVYANYDEVIGQLQSLGLVVDHLEVGKLRRCKVDGDREKRGWYSLHELRIDSGELLLVGTYGIWRGAENNAQKIELKKRTLTDEQRQALKTRMAEDKRRAEAARKRENEDAATTAAKAWAVCLPDGQSDYLRRKGVQGYEIRYSPSGSLVIPMLDTSGKVHGLQVIYAKKKHGRDKDFWPAGLAKKGHYFHIGGTPAPVLLICEGYATGASLHEATGLPVAVAFDANNLLPVAGALRKRHRNAKILFCADDDYIGKCAACGEMTEVAQAECRHCGQPHGKSNTGVSSAGAAALAVTGEWVKPVFAEARAGEKITDFNDLHAREGLHAVRSQIEARLSALKWLPKPAADVGSAPPGGRGNGKAALQSLLDVNDACERYALIYGAGGSMFDFQEHMLVPKSDVMDVLVDHGWREWKLRGDRKVVRLTEVGFDPAGTDPQIKCNLWGGWPTSPQSGRCEALLDLLRYLCAEEEKPEELFRWILCWLAYPIQNPGAKMKTALVMHGPQGAGKNMFFEAIMAIYGEYGRIVDQSAIEDKFNDWASKKLFLIADEVVARQELYHVKNKLKHLITGDWIRINPKNVAAHDERNHVNLVFLSNETQPLVLERDDRRYTVVWTPQKLSKDFYVEVSDEIAAGGIAALHHYLLHLDLGDFKPHTNPPDTRAKRELIEQSMDSTERFWNHWISEMLDGVQVVPCRSADYYDLYKSWCNRTGISRPAAEHIVLGNLGKRADCRKGLERYYVGTSLKQAMFITPLKCEQPPGKTKAAWMTECMEAFLDSAKEWKGA